MATFSEIESGNPLITCTGDIDPTYAGEPFQVNWILPPSAFRVEVDTDSVHAAIQ